MTVISIEYKLKAVGGLDFDETIINALKGTGARCIGSGCCLFGETLRDIQFSVPTNRDIQFSVPAKNIKEAEKRLNMVARNNHQAKMTMFIGGS